MQRSYHVHDGSGLHEPWDLQRGGNREGRGAREENGCGRTDPGEREGEAKGEKSGRTKID
jgi:hypothetical protein